MATEAYTSTSWPNSTGPISGKLAEARDVDRPELHAGEPGEGLADKPGQRPIPNRVRARPVAI